MITVTKIFKFDAAHLLPEYEGKCKNLHGHSFVLDVEIAGMYNGPKVYDTMVLDFGDLKQIVTEEIIDRLDHHYLNEIIPGPPTAENMVGWIARILGERGLDVVRVNLWETDTSCATWRKG